MGRYGRKSAVPDPSSSEESLAEDASSEDSESDSIEDKIISKKMDNQKERHPSLQDFLNRKPKIYQRIDRNDAEERVDQTFEMLYDTLQVLCSFDNSITCNFRTILPFYITVCH